MPTKVDHSALKVNQASIILLTILAFILGSPWLVLFVGAVMAYGTARKQAGFKVLYTGLLKPRGWVKPDVIVDNPEPHVFAQGFGAVFVGASVLALFAGADILGWSLAWIVVALAALNFFLNFCAGCAVYYWLNRLNVPGFIKPPPPGVFPGMRPQSE
jgi:hypothetical protein